MSETTRQVHALITSGQYRPEAQPHCDPRAITEQQPGESEADYIKRRADGWKAWHDQNYQFWKRGGSVKYTYGRNWPAKEREFQARLKLETTQPQPKGM